MPADISREEFEARGGVVEREIDGEKLVTRHILEQTRHNSDDLAALKSRMDRVERKVDALDTKIDLVEGRLSGQIDLLRRDLPTIVGDVVREVFRGRGG